MAVLESAALLEAEIDAGVEVFKLLDPEVQKGFIALFHLFRHKQRQVSTELQKANGTQPAASLGGAAGKDLSSTSLNPNVPSTG